MTFVFSGISNNDLGPELVAGRNGAFSRKPAQEVIPGSTRPGTGAFGKRKTSLVFPASLK